MGVSTSEPDQGIAVVTVDFPPVNALPVQGWYDLADAVRAAGRDPDDPLRRAHRGGPRLQRGRRHQGDAAGHRPAATVRSSAPTAAAPRRSRRSTSARSRSSRRCTASASAAASAWSGNADAIVASDDATFGLPGAGPRRARRRHPSGPAGPAAPDARALLHLAHRHRRTNCTPTARSGRSSRAPHCTTRHGNWRGRSRRRTATLLRLAKAAINGIDPVDVRRSYRFEQGFTFEANLSGVADRVRDTFGTPGGTPTEGGLTP